jgi:hypothetical protein
MKTASAMQKPEEKISESDNSDNDTQVYFSKCQNNTLGYQTPVKVSLMLPFSAKQSISYYKDSIKSSNEIKKAATRGRPFLDFYSGTLLAIEDLKKQGINIILNVYDISDARAIQNVLNDPELKETNLIIGPGFAEEIQKVSSFSNEHKINMVYPMSNTNAEIYKNPYLFHINSADTLYYNLMSDEIIRQAKGQNLLVILPEASETNAVNLKNKIKQKVFNQSMLDSEKITYLEYTPGKNDILEIQSLIDNNKHNYIVITSEKQANVSKTIPIIVSIKAKTKADITLFGMREWLKYQTIDPEEIHILNGTFFSPFGIDYNDILTQEFIKRYRQTFQTEAFSVQPFFQNPETTVSYSRYGMWGYDVTFYFITALYKYGENFSSCIDTFKPKQIQFNFKFKRISNWGGFYNNGLFMIRFNSDFSVETTPLR